MDGLEQYVVIYGPVGGLAIYAAFQIIGWQREKPARVEYARKSDVDAVTEALLNLRRELEEFTKEVSASLQEHDRKIVAAETRLEERKK